MELTNMAMTNVELDELWLKKKFPAHQGGNSIGPIITGPNFGLKIRS